MRAKRAIADIAAVQYGAFTAAQAYRADFTKRQVWERCVAGIWIVLYRGVYAVAGVPRTWHQDVMAAVLACGTGAAAAAATAAALSRTVEHRDRPVHVIVPSNRRVQPQKGFLVHRGALRRSDIWIIDGIRVTAPNRTVVDCAGTLAMDHVEAVLDTALFRGLTTVPALERYIGERGLEHRPGIGRLRVMLSDRRDGTSHSKLERIFFRKVKAAKLPRPMRQFPVGDKFIDISYPDQRVIIELDGAGSRFTAASLRADRRRQNVVVLALRGWVLLRFTWDDVVYNWPIVEAQLRQALA